MPPRSATVPPRFLRRPYIPLALPSSERYATDIPARNVAPYRCRVNVGLPPARVRRGGFGQPLLQPVGAQDFNRPLPASRVVAAEVEVDRRDPGLDRAPQRPADVGHQREEVHAGELTRIPPAEVRLAERGPQILVELGLLRGVAEVEAGVVVPAELV